MSLAEETRSCQMGWRLCAHRSEAAGLPLTLLDFSPNTLSILEEVWISADSSLMGNDLSHVNPAGRIHADRGNVFGSSSKVLEIPVSWVPRRLSSRGIHHWQTGKDMNLRWNLPIAGKQSLTMRSKMNGRLLCGDHSCRDHRQGPHDSSGRELIEVCGKGGWLRPRRIYDATEICKSPSFLPVQLVSPGKRREHDGHARWTQ